MANLALYNTTLSELQAFLQRTTAVASQKFTVIFDQEISDVKISLNDLAKQESEMTSLPFHDFTKDEFLGAWEDRQDITDSTAYVRKLRSEQWG